MKKWEAIVENLSTVSKGLGNDEFGDLARMILGDAVDFLKATQNPRVMTLEELLSEEEFTTPVDPRDHGMRPVWLETRKEGFTVLDCVVIFHTSERGYYETVSGFWDTTKAKWYQREYGFSWRCWTMKPSREQMDDAPWESTVAKPKVDLSVPFDEAYLVEEDECRMDHCLDCNHYPYCGRLDR